jgi:DNA polymerase III subunit gamma/tau
VASTASASTPTRVPAPASPASPASPVSSGAVDAAALRARWPEVLVAVQRERRVAWMQLSNASVESFADGVLTLAFAQAGVARGFLTGGYDKDLSKALSALFGITPRIATTLGSGGSPPADSGPGPSGPRPPASPAGPSSDGGRERAEPDARSGSTAGGRRRPDAAPAPPPSMPPPDEETDPGDQAAPEGLTGMDLIERELGGRVIEEIG